MFLGLGFQPLCLGLGFMFLGLMFSTIVLGSRVDVFTLGFSTIIFGFRVLFLHHKHRRGSSNLSF